MTELLVPGTIVELASSLAGYDAGSRGVILRTSGVDTSVLVRLAETGHALFISRTNLRIAEQEPSG